jgi:predicted acetyltransferase
MDVHVRVATDDDWAAMLQVDGRTFGQEFSSERADEARRLIDLSRFRLAVDGSVVVGIAGSYALDVSLPGGIAAPMGGVTWVAVAGTHRRQGVLGRLMQAVHDDIDARGEPVASLYASQSGIYERFGYGMATQIRQVKIEARDAVLLPRFQPSPGAVRFVSGDEARPVLNALWERWWRHRAGEVRRSDVHRDLLFDRRAAGDGRATCAYHLVHDDGYATYRLTPDWGDGFPQHQMSLEEIVTLTSDAHAALWHTLLSIDLVASITSRQVAVDDPLPYLLADPRALRTVNLVDGVWVSVRDVAVAFGARTYAADDRLVVEADGRRWSIEGGPDGGSARAVRTRPDLVTDRASLGALLYGGVRASALVAGRRMTARNADVVRRADLFFATSVAPHCQTMY